MSSSRKRRYSAPVKKTKSVPPEKTDTKVAASRVQMFLRARFNPLRSLTPELLGFYIDRFKIGYIRQLCLAWDSIKDRDDTIRLVTSLREKAISRFDYQIEMIENLDPSDVARAEVQKEKVEYFFRNMTVTSAIDENITGRQKLLAKQMMDCAGSKYSVHEIVWQPQEDGNLTAQLRHTPPWFFENITGKLRYLTSEGAAYGEDLDEGGWLITVGDGLMIATCIAYMFKTLPLRDWVTYCERNGMPAFIGTTDSPQGSPQYKALFEALQNLASDYAALKNNSEKIEVLDLKGSEANLPYEPLVKRMDAKIASMWRGGDLSTMSSGTHSQGRGSNRQEDEAEILIDDDVQLIDETINAGLVKYVVEYLFGEEPLVRYATIVPPKEATAQDIAIDQFLVGSGVQLSVEDALKRYGRVAAQPGEVALMPPKQDEQIPPGLGNISEDSAALLRSAHKRLTPAQAASLAPVRARFAQAMEADDTHLANEVEKAIQDLPALLQLINIDPPTRRFLEIAYSSALMDGLTNSTHQS